MSRNHVLVVDDSEEFNDLISLLLAKAGISVTTTTTPEEFFTCLKDSTPDLCIIDCNLGTIKGEGLQMIRAIRNKIGYELPLLMVSARNDKKTISYALEIGANDYVEKPLDKELFLFKINQYLDLNNNDEIANFYEHRVPTKYASSLMDIESKLKEVNEFGFTIETPNLFKKGSNIKLSGDILSEILGVSDPITVHVTESLPSNKEGHFMMKLDFEDNFVEYAQSIRQWLADKFDEA